MQLKNEGSRHGDSAKRRQAVERAEAVVDAALVLCRSDIEQLTWPQRMRLEQVLGKALRMIGESETPN